MAKSIRMKAVVNKDGIVEVKALIDHPMESGSGKTDDGKPIEAHFIRQIVITANGETVMLAHWSNAVSKLPFIGCKYQGKKGDIVKVIWVDNKEQSDFAETKVTAA